MSGRVSVVIPCFNAAGTVGESIESALAQTWREIEVIVVDDGSSDDSEKILRGFADRIKTSFGPNRGASAARNKGTALATGAYIQYLDADDLLAATAIEGRVSAIEASRADVAYGDWQRFESDADGKRRWDAVVARTMESVDADAEIACATDFWAPPAALLYRRGIVEAIGGWHTELPVIQDARFLFDAARQRARFVHVPGVSAFYRQTGSSLSRRNERAFMLDCYRNGIEIQSLWQADGPLTAARKAALAGIFDMTARVFFKFSMSEFDDAVTRFKAMSGRRFGYPEIAQQVTRFAGRDVATAALAAGQQVTRGLRSWLEGKR
jgi:glycosyltransferase involved in cell wall biosynthesis